MEWVMRRLCSVLCVVLGLLCIKYKSSLYSDVIITMYHYEQTMKVLFYFKQHGSRNHYLLPSR